MAVSSVTMTEMQSFDLDFLKNFSSLGLVQHLFEIELIRNSENLKSSKFSMFEIKLIYSNRQPVYFFSSALSRQFIRSASLLEVPVYFLTSNLK